MAIMAASKICGAPVESPSGQALGAITEIMIEAATGGVSYAVLAHGGVLGVGEKLFAVPWSAFTAAELDGKFTLDASVDALAGGTGIGKDAWPAEASADWLR